MHIPNVTRREVIVLGLSAALPGCSTLLGPEFPEDAEQPPESHSQVVATFIDRVHSGEYEAARDLFNNELANALSAEEIEETWNDQTGDLGDYDDVEKWAYAPDETDEENIETVYARVRMTEGHYDLQVSLDSELRMAGVYIIDVVRD